MIDILKDSVYIAKHGNSIFAGYGNIIICVISVAITIAVLALSLRWRRKTTLVHDIKQKVLNGKNVDYDNVVASSFKAKALYDDLKGKCHPDRFNSDELNKEATEIFQLLVQNKYDYKKLCVLKERAIKNLHIKL